MSAPPRRRVALVTCGGTISSVGAHTRDFVDYGVAGTRLPGPAPLLERVPEVADEAEIVPVAFRAANSLTMGVAQWLALARLVRGLAASPNPVDGIVVAHGSATLEQTAYFLALTVVTPPPVVLTAALRPHGVLGSDAGINLLNAVRVAATPDIGRAGVVVVANNEIHAAREVTKGAGHHLGAFWSPRTGPLGYVEADGSVALDALPARGPQRPFDPDGRDDLPPVGIAYSYADAGATVIDALVASGVAGLVSVGHGAGSVTPEEDAALAAAVERGVVVVQASSANRGRVLLGSRRRRTGVLSAGTLAPLKARILLMLGLATTSDRQQLQALFERC